jgi:alpha/beta hydrolase fold
LILPAAWALQALAQTPATDELTSIDSDGTAHIKRAVPVPKTISSDAYELMVSGKRWIPETGTKQAADFAEKLQATYPVEITETALAGVACKVVIPKRAAPHKQDRVLICLHGGGFTSDSGSTLESATIAALTGIKVIAVEYRVAPQYPFPACASPKLHPAEKLNRRLDILTVESRLDRPTHASWKAMKTQADGILAKHNGKSRLRTPSF